MSAERSKTPSHVSRRRFLQYAPITTAAVAVPVVSLAAAPPEEPWDKARRLAKELSETLDQCNQGKWMVHIMPAGKGLDLPVMFENLTARANHVLSPEARMRKAAAEYKKAAMEIDPTCTEWWDAKADDDSLQMRFFVSGSRKVTQS